MNKKARLTAIGLAVVSALVMGGCGSGSTTPKPEAAKPTTAKATPTPTLLPVPEGCPTADEFTQAMIEKTNWVTAVEPALLNISLASPLPDGACAYVFNEGGTATTGTEVKFVDVLYFNIDTPGRPTHADLVKWAVDAGATPALDSSTDVTSDVTISLPVEFSNFDLGTFVWKEGKIKNSSVFNGPDVIPAFTQRAYAEVRFYMAKQVVEPLLAATAAGLDPTDKSKALAAGIPLASSVTFIAKDTAGYTVEYDMKVTLQPFTTDVTNSAPGKYEVISTAAVSGTVTNTTPQRNTTTGVVGALVLYPYDSPACTSYRGLLRTDSNAEPPPDCEVWLTGLDTVELGPDSVQAFPDLSSFQDLRFGPYPESGPELGAYNAPIAIYATLKDGYVGYEPGWGSDQGCEVSEGGYNGKTWVIPMDGWPDPICNP